MPRVTETEPIAEFAELLRRELGDQLVSTDPARIRRVSSDWARLSPILMEKIPPGRFLADLVVKPSEPEQVPAVLALAYEHDVPVTPRGAGTGNYGQATPFSGGILLDLRGLDQVVSVDAGSVTTRPGARLTTVDRAVRAADADLWMFPSTKGSTLGGFVGGGSAGTGTIEHGTTADGWVESLRVAPCDGSGTTFTVSGSDALAYIHAYGVSGILTELTVRTSPAREWVSFYASFDGYAAAVEVHRALPTLPVLPRLASVDEPGLVPTLPSPVGLDPDRVSLRVILEASTVAEVSRLVRAAGGTVDAVIEGYEQTDRLSTMSYNHPVYFLQQSGYPCFHLEVGGLPLWDDPDAVKAVYPNSMLHLDLGSNLGSKGPIGMLVADYESESRVLAGFAELEALGIGIHSPHQWNVDRHVSQILATVPRTDPKGLLNPGKLNV
jgi:hypothetical protein